jgi:hypothetical protein
VDPGFWQSVTFLHGWFTDPGQDPDPDPALFFSDFQDVIKKNKFVSPFLLITLLLLLTVGALTSVFKKNNSQMLRKKGSSFTSFCLLVEGSGSALVQIITVREHLNLD